MVPGTNYSNIDYSIIKQLPLINRLLLTHSLWAYVIQQQLIKHCSI